MKPLIDAEQATKLLDEVLYERVAELFDFAELFELEQQLWSALHAAGVTEREIGDIATTMLDQAMRRLHDDPRRHVDIGRCALCEEESQQRTRRKAS